MIEYSVWLLHPSIGYPLAVVDNYLSLQYTKVTDGVGSFALELPLTFNFDLIQEDMRLVVWRKAAGGVKKIDFCGFVRYIEEQRKGKRSRAIAGVDLNEILNTRIVAYASGTAQASMSDQADDMMKEIVRDNLGADATAARNISSYGFTVQANAGLGTSVQKSFSWRNVLKALQDIAEASHSTETTSTYFGVVPLNSGWDCEFRTNIVQWGMDHRYPSGAAGPVLFSLDFGNLSDVVRSTDWRDEVTYVYAGGQGEQEDRVTQEASDSTRIGASPFNRREYFVDARNETAAAAVLDAADRALRNGRPKNAIAGKIVNAGSYLYGRDYEFGDYVTGIFDGEVVDLRIETVYVKVAEGREQIDLGLGAAGSSLAISAGATGQVGGASPDVKIWQVVQDLERRLEKLESQDESLLDHGAQVINVKHKNYGAKGDGATDDTAAIQAAINALPVVPYEGGTMTAGIVYFPPGNYRVTSSIAIPSGIYLRLCGSGPRNSVIDWRGGNTDGVITVVAEAVPPAANSIIIEDLQISNSIGATVNCISVGNTAGGNLLTHLEFRRLFLRDCGAGIAIYDEVDDVIIEKCWFFDCAYGIKIYAPGIAGESSYTIRDNNFQAFSEYAVDTQDGGAYLFERNIFQSNAAAVSGIWVDKFDSVNIIGNYFESNTVGGATGSYIKLGVSAYASNGGAALIAGNHFDYGTAKDGQACILVDYAKSVHILPNFFTNTRRGIELTANALRVIMEPQHWGTTITTKLSDAGAIEVYTRDSQLEDAAHAAEPCARVTRVGNQSINNTTHTAIQFTAEEYDTAAMVDLAANNTRITCTIPGKYLVSGALVSDAPVGGEVQIAIRKNGGTYLATQLTPASVALGNKMSVTDIFALVATDYVELVVYQTSGVALIVAPMSFAASRVG